MTEVPSVESVSAQAVQRLRAAGCVAAEEEALELAGAAGGDVRALDALVERRCTGEPLAWVVGSLQFCGETIVVDGGVYVPRLQTEPLAWEAVARLPEAGVAVDLCTGAGAVAAALRRHRPLARVLGTELDPLAAACARANGVEVVVCDMAAGLPAELYGRVDVVTAIVPYVPTAALHLLPRDVLAYEPRSALDGGADGTRALAAAASAAAVLLAPGGSLLMELGADQPGLLAAPLAELGYREVEVAVDEDGDVRALYCRR